MERVKGEKYWSIVQTMHGFEVCDFVDDFDEWDNADFEIGNRFPDRESAEAMAKKFRAVLKGAEVIEMPSEEEIRSAYIEKIPCWCKDGDPSQYIDCDICSVEDERKMFSRGVEWLKSKIVK